MDQRNVVDYFEQSIESTQGQIFAKAIFMSIWTIRKYLKHTAHSREVKDLPLQVEKCVRYNSTLITKITKARQAYFANELIIGLDGAEQNAINVGNGILNSNGEIQLVRSNTGCNDNGVNLIIYEISIVNIDLN